MVEGVVSLGLRIDSEVELALVEKELHSVMFVFQYIISSILINKFNINIKHVIFQEFQQRSLLPTLHQT
jgi:hypothetical protein